MNINWFEIVAQMINFFILLFLLHKLLYKPVTKAMEQRLERISKDKNEADAKMKDANELIEKYENKMAGLKEKEKKILEHSKEEAQEKKEALIEQYKKEAQEKGDEFLKEIQEEKENFLNELRKSLGKNALKVASNILSILSKSELKESVFNSFMEKIKNLDKEALKDEDNSDDQTFELLASEPLSDQQKTYFEEKLKEIINYKSIDYKIDDKLIVGYELKLDTITVHTNIKKYLDEAEKNILKTLEKESL